MLCGKARETKLCTGDFDNFQILNKIPFAYVACHGTRKSSAEKRAGPKHAGGGMRERTTTVGTWVQVCLAASGGGPLLRTNGSVSSPPSISLLSWFLVSLFFLSFGLLPPAATHRAYVERPCVYAGDSLMWVRACVHCVCVSACGEQCERVSCWLPRRAQQRVRSSRLRIAVSVTRQRSLSVWYESCRDTVVSCSSLRQTLLVCPFSFPLSLHRHGTRHYTRVRECLLGLDKHPVRLVSRASSTI